EQVAVLVPIDEDSQLSYGGNIFTNRAHALWERVVVGVGSLQELDAASAQARHRRQDVGGAQRDVLYAGSAVVIEVLLNLAAAPAGGGLVDRHLDRLGVVRHHDAHERAVLGGDVLVVEAQIAPETHHPRVVV